LLMLMMLLVTQGAWAGGKKIIVFEFEGKGGAAVRDRLVKALVSAGYGIVPRAEAKAAAQNLGYKAVPEDPMGRLKIAASMNVDGFIAAELKVKGSSRALTVEVFATCENGIVHELDYDWSGSNVPSDTVSLMVSQIEDELDKAVSTCWKKPEPVGPAVPGPAKEEEKEKKKGVVVLEGEAGRSCELGGKNCGDKGKNCKYGGIRCGLPSALVIDFGFLVSSRNLEVSTADATGRITNYKYEGAAYPLFGFDLRLNIGRLFRAHPMFCLGILLEFAHSFLLVSHPRDRPDVEMGTKDVRLKAGLALEVAPKPGKLPLWVFIDLGWAMHDFLVPFDPVENVYVADYDYQMVDIGLGLRADLVRRWLDLGFRFGFRIPYTLGDAEDYYGGKASGRFGYSIGARIGGVIAYGLHWSIGFDWIQYMANFSGQGLVEGFQCQVDGTTVPCPSGKKSTDNYPTGYFMIGYRM
jgi:hypothetical protein